MAEPALGESSRSRQPRLVLVIVAGVASSIVLSGCSGASAKAGSCPPHLIAQRDLLNSFQRAGIALAPLEPQIAGRRFRLFVPRRDRLSARLDVEWFATVHATTDWLSTYGLSKARPGWLLLAGNAWIARENVVAEVKGVSSVTRLKTTVARALLAASTTGC